jgi:uncharacterized membrane protein YfcA
VAAGFLAGLLGIGGGLVVVPALVVAFAVQGVSDEVATHMAVATSLATIVVTGFSSAVAHHRRQAVQWPAVALLGAGLVLGSGAGAVTSFQLSPRVLQGIIGTFLLFMAVKMVWPRPSERGAKPLGRFVLALSGVGIGWASAILGIGGGLFAVPLLRRGGFTMVRAVGTSAACGFVLAIGGVIVHLLYGSTEVASPSRWGLIHGPAFLGIVATSLFAAPLGARVAHRLPGRVLRLVFALFLFGVGLRFWVLLGLSLTADRVSAGG